MRKNNLICIISDNNIEFIKKAILEIENIDTADLLVIDDGSEYDIIEEIKEYSFVKCIIHEMPLGYGSCLDTAFTYARDMEYKYLLTLNPETAGVIKDVPAILDNLKYGYDIVTCSRILENYDYNSIDKSLLEIYEIISQELNNVAELNLTDPLSENKGYNIEALNEVELTDKGHGVLLQVFIQGAYFGSNIIEIPSESGLSFGEEICEYENPLEELSAVIETEKYLYDKGSIN